MQVPRIVGNCGVGTELIEQPSGNACGQQNRQHRLPACYAGHEQQDGAKRDSPYAGLTYRTRNQTVHSRPEVCRHEVRLRRGGELREWGSAGETVHQCMSAVPAPCAFRTDERLVTGHVRRICKEQERTSDKCHVEDVIARSAEHFFGEDYGEGNGDSHLPQRGVNRHNQRDDEAGHKESFCHFFVLDLRHDKLNTQTNRVRNDDERQHGE